MDQVRTPAAVDTARLPSENPDRDGKQKRYFLCGKPFCSDRADSSGVRKKIKRLLTSPKIIVSLIITTLAASFAGVLIPQSAFRSAQYFENWKTDSPATYALVDLFGLNRVFSSQWFLFLVLLLTLVLSYSVYLQGSVLVKKQRNNVRKWGRFLFHIGLLVVVLASLYTLAFQKRGFVQIIETDTYSGDEQSLLAKELGVFAKGFVPGFRIQLDRVEHSYWEDGAIKELKSLITVSQNGSEETATLGINKTLSVKGITLYQARSYGYTLSFLFKRKNGEAFYTHFNIVTPPKPEKPYDGVSDIPTTGYILRMKFYPDVTKRSFYLNKPSLHLTIERGSETHSGMVYPGQTIALRQGEQLIWTAIRPWSGIRLVESRGTPVVFFGFALSIAGLIALYFIPQNS